VTPSSRKYAGMVRTEGLFVMMIDEILIIVPSEFMRDHMLSTPNDSEHDGREIRKYIVKLRFGLILILVGSEIFINGRFIMSVIVTVAMPVLEYPKKLVTVRAIE